MKLANPNCPECNGTGFLEKEHGGSECPCVLKNRALGYLTPEYASALYTKTLNVERLEGKDLFIFQAGNYKGLVKSYLLNTGMRFSHLTGTAYDIMQAYLGLSGEGNWQRYQNVDFLVLIMQLDPPNRSYTEVVGSMIKSRHRMGKRTWIIARDMHDSTSFKQAYGQIGDVISECGFTPFKLGS